MKNYQGGSYQERVGRAADAKQKALDKLKAMPVADEADLAARREAATARDEAQAEKRRLAKQAKVEAEAAAAVETESKRPPTEEERKAARDARYAARKSRK